MKNLMTAVLFALFGLVTAVYASGTSSSSSSWGQISSDQQNPDTSQGTSSDDQQNTDASQGAGSSDQQNPDTTQGAGSSDQQNPDTTQGAGSGNQENLVVSMDAGLSDIQKKSAVKLYDQGMQANKNGDYQKARSLFEQALTINSNNPDILNMLAHTQLKVGLIDQSLENYKKALQLRPRFPEAREYLGETYIQAALRELTTLKSYGEEGEEQAEDLRKALKDAAGNL